MIGAHPKELEKAIADIKAIKWETFSFFTADETAYASFLKCQIYSIDVARQIGGSYKITVTLKYPGIFLGPEGIQVKALLNYLTNIVGADCEFMLIEHDIWE